MQLDPLNINSLPNELIEHILFMLPLNDQLTCRQVCGQWTELAENVKNKEAILGPQILAKLGMCIFNSASIPEAPKEFIKGAKVRNRLIVLIPEGISEEKIGELMKKKFSQNKNGYKFVPSNIKKNEEYKRVVEKSYWIGITRTLIKEKPENKKNKHSEGKQLTYNEANEYVKKFHSNPSSICRLPKRLEVSLAALLKFAQTGERLLKRDTVKDKWNMSWCKETVSVFNQEWGTAVGNFESDGISVYDLYNITGIGIDGRPEKLDKLGVIPVYEF